MNSPELILRLATASDLPAIARCWYYAFFDDEVIGDLMHPHREESPEDVYYFLLRGVRERFWDWRHQFIVITVIEEGIERIVGAADWRRIGDGGKAMELPRLDPRNLISPTYSLYHNVSLYFFPNRAADPARASILNSAVESAASYWTGKHSQCWDLYVCGVHPDYQGKGIGKALVDWGIRKADEERTSASVLCGEKNRVFYNKAGLTEDMGGLKSSSGGNGGIALFRSVQQE
ncbi:hypothetical protein BU24DRAFT_455288 [Aaosphaeria arxii CBS 175.79]|uniref:N-acetyltransferase domain-containing protein n=1 Tax=Aaosphaeria arxii CBS 175.79 TaxID=1450172 RepID=A0A6A5XBJ7_9PLEO|nr:uncharacterized protein BU24DRAFT_455288 [Aaosphaeria arxii CBS 175.79]KAF2010154.1 hypothetical protein BU24DRAFT_455288 [Aaosphaeria arxii CBS 175.79]